MIGHSGNGWLTTLADLSIILFMITAADLSNAQTDRHPAQQTVTAPATAEPVASYRPEPGVMPFGAWLATQPADNRQRVTVLVRYSGTDAQERIAVGMALAELADKAGRSARLIVEKAEHGDVVAMLTYDTASEPVARNLLDSNRQGSGDRASANRQRPEES